MLLPVYKLWGVCEDIRFEHALSHHPNHPQFNSCSLCSHHGIEKGHEICRVSVRDDSFFGVAVDMGVAMLFLLMYTAKCACFFLPFLMILLSGDVELNPGPNSKYYYCIQFAQWLYEDIST